MRVEAFEDKKRRGEVIALLKLANFSVDDTNNSRLVSSNTLKQRLANRRSNLEEKVGKLEEKVRS